MSSTEVKNTEEVKDQADGIKKDIAKDAAKEPKQPKAPKGFLADNQRAEMIAQLDEWGIDAKDLSDMDLIDKLKSYAVDMTNKVVVKKGDELAHELALYAQGSNLKDLKFIARLRNLNIPSFYLENLLFTDADMNLTDLELWSRIRRSGINPYPENHERLKSRYTLPKKKPRISGAE